MPSKELPITGEVFFVEGCTAFLIQPSQATDAGSIPWVWYAPTLPAYPGPEERWMFERFTAAGLAIAGIDVGESYGSPAGRRLYTALYEELVSRHGLSRRSCLLARSRGGLMHYNWAVEHPTSVACIAGIYPVCNLSSYPGLEKAAPVYGLTVEELVEALPQHNPLDRVEPLAKAGVPIFHIQGDSDTAVPLESNSAELQRRYSKFGGEMTVKVIEGGGHDMSPHWFQSQELVDFVITHARD
jgi:pimeloyl-ACP methyl ester carboxylesterase